MAGPILFIDEVAKHIKELEAQHRAAFFAAYDDGAPLDKFPDLTLQFVAVPRLHGLNAILRVTEQIDEGRTTENAQPEIKQVTARSNTSEALTANTQAEKADDTGKDEVVSTDVTTDTVLENSTSDQTNTENNTSDQSVQRGSTNQTDTSVTV
jgi:hypothetical protein